MLLDPTWFRRCPWFPCAAWAGGVVGLVIGLIIGLFLRRETPAQFK